MRRSVLFVTVLCAACATAKPAPAPEKLPEALPATGAEPSADLVVRRGQRTPLAPAAKKPEDSPLRLDEAQRVVADLERRQAEATPNEPLRNPKTIDDIFEILKRDQIDLFGGGVALASKMTDPQAVVLHGQIELAWGEALLLVGDLLEDVSIRMRDAAAQMEPHEKQLEPEAKDRLSMLRQKQQHAARLSSALGLVGMQHLWNGASLAQTVIDEQPDSYLGYRLAADFYRLRGDWKVFDEMVAAIEKLNPESNGLVFLKGVAALNRDSDIERARAQFRKALARDPKFVRAQVYLYLASPFVSDAFDELLRLKEQNPNHQLVVWALPAVAEAYEAGVLVRKPSTARPAAAPAVRAVAPAEAPAAVPAAAPVPPAGK